MSHSNAVIKEELVSSLESIYPNTIPNTKLSSQAKRIARALSANGVIKKVMLKGRIHFVGKYLRTQQDKWFDKEVIDSITVKKFGTDLIINFGKLFGKEWYAEARSSGNPRVRNVISKRTYPDLPWLWSCWEEVEEDELTILAMKWLDQPCIKWFNRFGTGFDALAHEDTWVNTAFIRKEKSFVKSVMRAAVKIGREVR